MAFIRRNRYPLHCLMAFLCCFLVLLPATMFGQRWYSASGNSCPNGNCPNGSCQNGSCQQGGRVVQYSPAEYTVVQSVSNDTPPVPPGSMVGSAKVGDAADIAPEVAEAARAYEADLLATTTRDAQRQALAVQLATLQSQLAGLCNGDAEKKLAADYARLKAVSATRYNKAAPDPTPPDVKPHAKGIDAGNLQVLVVVPSLLAQDASMGAIQGSTKVASVLSVRGDPARIWCDPQTVPKKYAAAVPQNLPAAAFVDTATGNVVGTSTITTEAALVTAIQNAQAGK